MDCRILTNGLDSKRKKNIKKKVFEERFEESMQYWTIIYILWYIIYINILQRINQWSRDYLKTVAIKVP